jgi:hypothetical protein
MHSPLHHPFPVNTDHQLTDFFPKRQTYKPKSHSTDSEADTFQGSWQIDVE